MKEEERLEKCTMHLIRTRDITSYISGWKWRVLQFNFAHQFLGYCFIALMYETDPGVCITYKMHFQIEWYTHAHTYSGDVSNPGNSKVSISVLYVFLVSDYRLKRWTFTIKQCPFFSSEFTQKDSLDYTLLIKIYFSCLLANLVFLLSQTMTYQKWYFQHQDQ